MATCIRKVLKDRLREQSAAAQAWFQKKCTASLPAHVPFYSSFDLRDADYKIAPVDANLFPAGFNNICPDDLEQAPPLMARTFERIMGRTPVNVLIIPENHTRNAYYAENLYELRQILRNAGMHAEIGWYEDPATTETSAVGPDHLVRLATPEGTEIEAYPIRRDGNRVVTENFVPDTILLNNDFSSGFPQIFTGLEQPVIPSAKLGWHTRRKSSFFTHYNRLVKDFANEVGIDAWDFTIKTERVTPVDFLTGEGMDRVTEVADRMLTELRTEYKERCIEEPPFLFIKNNAGTYGIGIMRISDVKELSQLNRRDRNKMHTGKGNQTISDVIIQEGVATRFQIDGVYAEPVIYLTGSELLGGFLRKNPNRGKDDNLNSKGMVFQKLCIADLKNDADRDLELELVYGTLARISALAVMDELKELA